MQYFSSTIKTIGFAIFLITALGMISGAASDISATPIFPLSVSVPPRTKTVTQIPVTLIPGNSYCLYYSAQGRGSSGTTTGYHEFRLGIGDGESHQVYSNWEDTWNGAPLGKQFKFVAPGKDCNMSFENRTSGSVVFSIQEITDTDMRSQTPEVHWQLSAPAWRNQIYASEPKLKEVTGKLILDQPPQEVWLSLDGKDWKHMEAQQTQISFALPLPEQITGDFSIFAKWRTSTNITKEAQLPIRRLAAAPHEVRIGPDKRLYVDGQPFFPILWWENYDADMEDTYCHMAAIGLNVALADVYDSPERALLLLDQAWRHGLRLMLFTKSHFLEKDDPDSVVAWQQKLSSIYTKEVRNHPALLGYLLADEPMWAGVSETLLKKSYDFYQELDPFHPVWINSAPRGTIEQQKPYIACTDICGVDIYPIPEPSGHSGIDNKTISCVGDYAARMNQIADNRKPVWMALQGFAWGNLDPKVPIQYPTSEEMRFMVYDSLIQGADGLSWWGNYAIQDVKFYDVLERSVAEVRDLAYLLAHGERSARVSLQDGIMILPIKYQNNDWLLAINRSPQQQKVMIPFPSPDRKWKNLRTNESLQLTNGNFEDTLEGRGTRLYGTAPLPQGNEVRPATPNCQTDLSPWRKKAAAAKR